MSENQAMNDFKKELKLQINERLLKEGLITKSMAEAAKVKILTS